MSEYERNPRNYTLLADAYEYFMSDAYLVNDKGNVEAVFDVFFRKIPNEGGYAIMAGIDKLIEYIENLRFGPREIEYFKKNGYSSKLINYLENFRFTGDIYAIPDGTPVFPNEPLITVKAPIVEAQIIETALLSIINGSMEHATAARRIVEAVPKGVKVMEFGARRADGLEAAIDSSLYGIMVGCDGTSNILAADMVGLKALGTMAHSFVETFDNEFEAFKAFVNAYPHNATLLVDTYDTLRSGVPNAIKTFRYMQDSGMDMSNIGIRIDSGDLAYLSKEARRMLDEAGFSNAKICLSNGLDAKTIESLVMQGARFDSLGVGDNISKPNGRMGAVYKEVAVIENGYIKPRIKVSEDIVKIVNPGFKKLYRAYDKKTGYAFADIICDQSERIDKKQLTIVSLTDFIKSTTIQDYNLVILQKKIFENGRCIYDNPSLDEKKKYVNEQMDTLYPEVKRLLNPHGYYVDGTQEYATLKRDMIKKYRKI